MTHSGWRKPTPGTGGAGAPVRSGEGEGVSKGRALAAAKRVGARIGLKAADLLLLDMLGAFSQDCDWEAGARPIVWPSNATLMTRTGFSLSALKRHIRRLAEAGLIGFEDSPNGKRWGRRDREGRIAEAYGFDLSPLRARAAEFERLDQALTAERARRAWLGRRITVARRTLAAWIEAGARAEPGGRWERARALLARLSGRVPGRSAPLAQFDRMLGRLTWLRARLERLPRGAATEADPMGSDPGLHIPTTTQPESVEEPAKPAENGAVTLSDIRRACPEFISWGAHCGETPDNWPALGRLADRLHAMIGVSQRTWAQAWATLGARDAPAALALVFDKASQGRVVAPDAYLRELLRRAGRGELRLAQSLRGRGLGLARDA